jgi:hypothetical protein
MMLKVEPDKRVGPEFIFAWEDYTPDKAEALGGN